MWLTLIVNDIQCFGNTVQQALNAVPEYSMNLMDVELKIYIKQKNVAKKKMAMSFGTHAFVCALSAAM